jgi:AhpD family alkylhydroperoxidase
MDARLKLFESLFAGELPRRAIAAGQVVKGSPLPAATQELVPLRARPINGCDCRIDSHTKDAVAAGESSVPLSRETTVFTEADRRCERRQPAARQHPAARRRLSVRPTRTTSHIQPPAGGEMLSGHAVVDVARHPLNFGDWLSA